MAGTRNQATQTEAVAVFHDVNSFQAAIDDLLLAGFDHGDVNVLAHEHTVKSQLGREYQSTAEFEDNPEAPRIGFVPVETIGDAEGAVIGAGMYLPAIAHAAWRGRRGARCRRCGRTGRRGARAPDWP